MLETIRKKIEGYTPEPIGRQRAFAVFLPLIRVGEDLHVLFEKRSQIVSQPGETSFPGGALEEGETYKDAAIRETQEELNLESSQINIFGEIDYIATQSHIIHCFVGELVNCEPDAIRPNEEVESIFTVPLTYFVRHAPEYHSIDLKVEHKEDFPFELISNGSRHKWSSRKQLIPFYRLDNQFLWGYTAQFTHRFIELIEEDELLHD
ncbi:MAG: CoA pyrophosphatase [Alkalibacterium sp.]|nr:CoA pyrophosphatase [Alkalibacterium sp.]